MAGWGVFRETIEQNMRKGKESPIGVVRYSGVPYKCSQTLQWLILSFWGEMES